LVVADSTTTLTYQKKTLGLGSLLGVELNFSIFAVISVQSKAFKKSIENCVERILWKFMHKKKVFHTISSSEVWPPINKKIKKKSPIFYLWSLHIFVAYFI
jgi:hypothetical protein